MGELPKVCIVGVGLIGGSLGLALRRSGKVSSVLGVSRRPTVSEALKLGAIDEGFAYGELENVIRRSDIVVLATPITRIFSLLEEISGFDLPGHLVVTDVGSTKSRILSQAQRLLPEKVCFVGGHPMTGSERRGVAASDPFLFQNSIYLLCPAAKVPEKTYKNLAGLLEATGAHVMVIDAETHDRTVAAVSHLPQLLAVSLVNFAAGAQEHQGRTLQLAAGGFRDMTRIASSPFSVWKDIVGTNKRVIKELLQEFSSSLSAMAENLEPEALGEAFDKAALLRSRIPKDTKGFLKPLFELLVVVEDKPGMISSLAVPLAKAGINIQDIEVLKVRENEGGTLRLAFKSKEASEQAGRILSESGFEVRHKE